MDKLYHRIGFENSPSKKTSLSEKNLNLMDKAIDDLDNRVIEQHEALNDVKTNVIPEVKKDLGEQITEETNKVRNEYTHDDNEVRSEFDEKLKSKADAITVEKSGITIIATDSSDKGFEQFKIYGKSEQERTSGKNLFKNTITSQTINDLKFTVNDDGTVIVNGTPSKDAYLEVTTDVLPKGSYIFTGTPSGGSSSTYYSAVKTADGSSVIGRDIGNGLNFELSEDSSVVITAVAVKKTVAVSNLTFKPMIRKVDITNSTYEPYTGGQASPNPEYPQPIVSAGQKLIDGVATDTGIEYKVTGANLLDLSSLTSNSSYGVTWEIRDGYVKANGTATGYSSKTVTLNLEPGTYALNGQKNSSDCGLTYFVVVVSASGKSTNYYDVFTLDGTETSVKAKFQVNTDNTASDDVVYPMLNEGTEALPYEPYIEQTLTINKVLRGIPVTDSSLATYTDENGQMWCADYGDVERKVWVQRVGVVEDNGIIKWSSSTKVNMRYSTNISDALGNTPPLCNQAITADGEGLGQSYITNSGNFYVNTAFATVEDWKAHLSENPIIIQYILATPIETPMTDEEIAAYEALHTNKPNTIITNDAGCFMVVKYVADTKTHIVQNYVPVTAFNDVLERISALEQLHV